MQLPTISSPQLPDPMWRGWIGGPNGALPGGASALPGPTPGVPALSPQGGQGLIQRLFSRGMKYGLGGIGQAAALLMGQPNNPDVVAQIKSNAAADGRADPFAAATPMSQSNLGQAVAPQTLPQIPDLGTTPAYGSTPMPTAQSMPLPQGAQASPFMPMPRQRPAVPAAAAAPFVNPDQNFYNGPGSSSFGAGGSAAGLSSPAQNFNVGRNPFFGLFG